jgi:hypothetical protein
MIEVKTVRKTISCILLVSLIATLTATAFATPVHKGNGAPNGPHFNLNIIGVPKEKKGEMSGNGNVIFVKLWGADTKINLIPGNDFAVLDKDGTDGKALLQLMDPYPEDETPGINTGEEPIYRIYIRALGKPGGEMGMTSGFTDEYDVDWYSLESINLTRNKGKSRFTDKTLELTTIYVDITDDQTDNPVRYNLFGNELWDYFWDYDNSGLKLLQMRIYVE